MYTAFIMQQGNNDKEIYLTRICLNDNLWNLIETILIPKDNTKDLDDIPQEVKDAITFIPVSNCKQVLQNALVN